MEQEKLKLLQELSTRTDLPDDKKAIVSELLSRNTVSKKPSADNGKKLLLTGVGQATAGALGGAVYALSKPYLKEWNTINPQLRNMQKQLGIEGTQESFIPQKLQMIEQETRRNLSTQKMTVSSASKQTINNLKQQLNQFDENILSKDIGSLAEDIKVGYPKWKQSGYKQYDAFLGTVDDILSKSDISISPEEFNNNVIQKTISYAESKGALPKDIEVLNSFRKDFLGAGEESKISYKQIKGMFNRLDKVGAVDPIYVRNLKEHWGSYLEKVAPPDVKPLVQEVNSAYKPFAEARNTIEKLVNTKTGEMDTNGVVNYLKKYVKSNIETGTQKVLDLLGEGNKIVEGISGVGEQGRNLGGLKAQRKIYAEAPLKAQATAHERLLQIETSLRSEIDRLSKMRAKSMELLSQKSVLQSKQYLNPLKIIGKALKPMAKGMGLMGAYPMVSEMLQPPPNPEEIRRAMLPPNIIPNVLGIGNRRNLPPS